MKILNMMVSTAANQVSILKTSDARLMQEVVDRFPIANHCRQMMQSTFTVDTLLGELFSQARLNLDLDYQAGSYAGIRVCGKAGGHPSNAESQRVAKLTFWVTKCHRTASGWRPTRRIKGK